MQLALAAPELLRRLVLVEPIVAVLLPQTAEEAWRIFLDLRNGAGTWPGMSEQTRPGFLSTTEQALGHWRSNLNNPTTSTEVRGAGCEVSRFRRW